MQVILPVNYNINLHVAAFYGSTYVNEKSYKVENNNIHIEEMMKPDNYTVNIYVSTFIGDVRGDLSMNHYIRTIGSMLILVYSMLAAFLFIDKVFVNIIYFQGMFYTQIFGIPVFLFLNLIIILLCIIVGSVLAYKINQQNDWIKTQLSVQWKAKQLALMIKI